METNHLNEIKGSRDAVYGDRQVEGLKEWWATDTSESPRCTARGGASKGPPHYAPSRSLRRGIEKSLQRALVMHRRSCFISRNPSRLSRRRAGRAPQGEGGNA